MSLIVAFGILLILLIIYCCRSYTRFVGHGVKHHLPIPLVGNLLPVILQRRHFCEQEEAVYKSYPNEKFVGYYELGNPVILIRDPELVKKILVKDFDYFAEHRRYCDDTIEPAFGRNLAQLKGSEWKRMRVTLTPSLTNAKIRLMIPFMREVAESLIQNLNKQLDEAKLGYIDIECKDLTARYAMDIIATTVFGIKVNSFEERDNCFFKMGKSISTIGLRFMAVFLAMSTSPKLVEKLKLTIFPKQETDFFKNLVFSTWKDRETNNIERPDILQLLMQERKDWPDTDLFAQAVMFFIAGSESIATMLAFALHELALNPEIQERLVKDIQEHQSIHGDTVDYTALQDLPYLDMVISEVQRLWPSIPFVERVCVRDYNLGKPNKSAKKEYTIRCNETIKVSIWSLHRDPDLFEDPIKFDPERFSEEKKHLIKPSTYIPFSSGPRICIGTRFAACEIKVFLYQILLHFKVSPSEKACIPPLLCPKKYFTGLRGGNWVRFSSRKNSNCVS